MEQPGTSHTKLEQTKTGQKQFQASGTKEIFLLCWRPMILIDIQWIYIALIFLKNTALL